MYVLAMNEFARSVPLDWTRSADADGDSDVEQFTVPDALWSQRGGRHYLAFTDPSGPTARLVLRVDPDAVTVVRSGDVAWRHSFLVGESRQSVLALGPQSVEVDIATYRVDVEVGHDGGRVEVDYHMHLQNLHQKVLLRLRFGTEAAGDGPARGGGS